MRKATITFLLGLATGIVVCWLFGRFVTPRLPAAFGGTPTLDTTVVEKQRDAGRLLLTVRAAETGEAVLVTITEQVDEIGLLVARGDTVTLRLPPNQPFATNPPIERVQKPDPSSVTVTTEGSEGAGEGTEVGGEPVAPEGEGTSPVTGPATSTPQLETGGTEPATEAATSTVD